MPSQTYIFLLVSFWYLFFFRAGMFPMLWFFYIYIYIPPLPSQHCHLSSLFLSLVFSFSMPPMPQSDFLISFLALSCPFFHACFCPNLPPLSFYLFIFPSLSIWYSTFALCMFFYVSHTSTFHFLCSLVLLSFQTNVMICSLFQLHVDALGSSDSFFTHAGQNKTFISRGQNKTFNWIKHQSTLFLCTFTSLIFSFTTTITQ